AQINAGLRRVVPQFNNFESRATLVPMAEFLGPILDGYRDRQSVNMYQVSLACRNQEAKGPFSPESYVDAPCPGYLFFDNLHPTTLAHCALAQLLEKGFQRVGFEVEVGGGGDFE